jgi:hypothetical protein
LGCGQRDFEVGHDGRQGYIYNGTVKGCHEDTDGNHEKNEPVFGFGKSFGGFIRHGPILLKLFSKSTEI